MRNLYASCDALDTPMEDVLVLTALFVFWPRQTCTRRRHWLVLRGSLTFGWFLRPASPRHMFKSLSTGNGRLVQFRLWPCSRRLRARCDSRLCTIRGLPSWILESLFSSGVGQHIFCRASQGEYRLHKSSDFQMLWTCCIF